jgi:hypothetical protein
LTKVFYERSSALATCTINKKAGTYKPNDTQEAEETTHQLANHHLPTASVAIDQHRDADHLAQLRGPVSSGQKRNGSRHLMNGDCRSIT